MTRSTSEQAGPTPAWFVPLTDQPATGVSVYACPQAGAGPTALAECAGLLGPHATVYGLSLPGRQVRFSEPPCVDRVTLLDNLVAGVPSDGRRWLLFGYCSGALIAYLLARRLHAVGSPLPEALLVASYPAPDVTEPPRALHRQPADRFWAEIIALGGIPAEVAAEPDFREVFESAMRADYALLADYRFEPGPVLPIPIFALAGDQDPVLRSGEVSAWQRHSGAGFTMRRVSGGHWLLADNPDAVATAVRDAFPGQRS